MNPLQQAASPDAQPDAAPSEPSPPASGDGVPERQRRAAWGQTSARARSAAPTKGSANAEPPVSIRGARAFSPKPVLHKLNTKQKASGRNHPDTPTPANARRFAWIFTLALLLGAGGLLLAQNSAVGPHLPIAAQAGMTAGPRVASAASRLPDEVFDPAKLLIAFALICVNALFSIAEYALITVRRTRIRQLVEEGSRPAAVVESLLAHPTRLMATIQTGVTVIATISSALAATSAVGPLDAWIRAHSVGFVAAHSATIALIVVTLPVAIVALVIGEVAPKSIVVRNPEPFALAVAQPVRWLQTVFTPVVGLLTFLSNLVVRPFGGTVSFTIPAVNKEELEILVEQSVEQGVVDNAEKDMITGILDFGATVARKIMTPRIDLTSFPVDGAMPDLIARVYDSGHSRIPIYEGDLDNIVGIVHAKDLLQLPGNVSRDVVPIQSVMRAPYFIPETKKVDALLAEFKRSKQQLAIVRDEYGVTSGLVTIEDVLEEIVGDIQDEYDEEESPVQVIDSATSILDGKMALDDVNERMGLELPEDEADTIGGFVFSLIGHAAAQGEGARWEDVEFVVEATDGRRITKVRLIHHYASEQTNEANGAQEARNERNVAPPPSRRAPDISGAETSPRVPSRR